MRLSDIILFATCLRFSEATLKQPTTWETVNDTLVELTSYALLGAGMVLVLSSYHKLGFLGTFLGTFMWVVNVSIYYWEYLCTVACIEQT